MSGYEVKKMIGRKGQGAMEYLMTYGWAILVVMIVGIVMWQLGIFNINQGSTTATGFSKLKPQLAAMGVKTNGQLNNLFTNGAGAKILVVSGHLSDLVKRSSGCTITSAKIAPNKAVMPGDNFRLSGVSNTCLHSSVAGDVYNAKLQLDYVLTVGGVQSTHVDVGTIRGPYEP